jgi:hypothetical protein
LARAPLIYNPETGWFTRKGKRAGASDCCKGYRRIMYESKVYKEHRLAWYFHYGVWPENQIDHINGIKDDNRIENLRDVSQTINMYNKVNAYETNPTGYLGVATSGKKYQARLKVDSKLLYLGTYDTPEEAHKVYMEVKQVHAKEALEQST